MKVKFYMKNFSNVESQVINLKCLDTIKDINIKTYMLEQKAKEIKNQYGYQKVWYDL